MNDFKKMSEWDMVDRLQVGEPVLRPLIAKSVEREVRVPTGFRVDARLVLALPETSESYTFILEAKSRSAPQLVQNAVTQAKGACGPGELPMIQVPYLSPERIEELEKEGISAIDLCGNGVVIVPGKVYVSRSGQPNLFPETRPLNNPYRGRSAMVARMLLQQPEWSSLSSLAEDIAKFGAKLSLAQVSKTVQALEEDMILTKESGNIRLQNALLLLDKLGAAWKEPKSKAKQALRLPPGKSFALVFSNSEQLKWALTGSSSVTRYTMFAQAGPRRIAVNSLPLALELLGVSDPVPANYADVELMETEEEGYFFANQIDEDGMRWASLLQTWLELQSGDGRQQDAASELRLRILNQIKR